MKTEFYKMEYESWDEGTDNLSLEQEAAYLRLCHQMYRRRGAIPESTQTLARLWRCHPNKARKLLDGLLIAKKDQLVRTPEGLACVRVMSELDGRGVIATSRSDAGRTGGRRSGEIRRKSLENKGLDEAFASSKTNQRREEKNREEKTTAAARARNLDDLQERIVRECGLGTQPVATNPVMAPILGLLNAGCDERLDIIPAIAARVARFTSGDKVRSWNFFTDCVIDWRNKRLGVGLQKVVAETPVEQETRWRKMLDDLAATRPWPFRYPNEIPREFAEQHMRSRSTKAAVDFPELPQSLDRRTA